MKTIRNSEFARFMAITAVTILTLGGFMQSPAQAQSFEQWLQTLNATTVSAVSTGDDTDVAFAIRYVGTGTSNSGTVEVTVTTSDVTFRQGVQGAEAASTELECPVSGALGGIIDVSDAACNTVGEVCDIVNDSTSWRCMAIDSLRSDVVDARLVTQAATRATTIAGLGVKWDTSTAFDYTMLLAPPKLRTMEGYLRGSAQSPGGPNRLESNVFGGTQTVFKLGNATSTFASGTSTLRVYSVLVGNMNTSNSWSEVVTEIYNEPGGATTVNKIFDDQTAVGGFPSRTGEKLLIRLDNSAAMSAVAFTMFGSFREGIR